MLSTVNVFVFAQGCQLSHSLLPLDPLLLGTLLPKLVFTITAEAAPGMLTSRLCSAEAAPAAAVCCAQV